MDISYSDQGSVEVRITESGTQMCVWTDEQCSQMASDLLDLVPSERQPSILDAMEEFSSLLDPKNRAFQEVLKRCCKQQECCDQEQIRGDGK